MLHIVDEMGFLSVLLILTTFDFQYYLIVVSLSTSHDLSWLYLTVRLPCVERKETQAMIRTFFDKKTI